MWSGKLETIRSTKRRIELNIGPKRVYRQPYRAAHKARGIKIEKVESMLRDRVIKPTMAEWASPVVLVQKKNDPR